MPAFGRRLVSKPAQGVSFPAENAWWKMDEGSGLTAFDSSGNGYNGSLLDGASFSGDIVSVGGNSPADRVSFDKGCTVGGAVGATVTLEAYFVSNASADRAPIWIEDTAIISYGRFALRTNSSNKCEFLIRDAARDPEGDRLLLEHAQVLPTETYVFIAGRMDSVANTMAVWVNDSKQVLTATLGAFRSSTPSNIYTGDYAGSGKNRRRFYVRNIRQYLTALTDQQIDDIRLGNV